MKGRAGIVCFILCLFACLIAAPRGAAQSRLEQGINLSRAGQLADAVMELRRSLGEAGETGQLAAALYWLSVTEFAMGEHAAALRDINELQRVAAMGLPAGLRMDDIIYYKARALYYLERPEDALPLFRSYDDLLALQNRPGTQAERTALTYWIGECQYTLGQMDQAEAQFTLVVNARPVSEKHEAASYRLALIQQNKTQAELMDMLDASYTEAQRMSEEYQRLLDEAGAQIRALEDRQAVPPPPSSPPGPEDTIRRIRELKESAERLRRELNRGAGLTE
jgi:tetratricopeptide (TPR) repeat protein